MSFFSENKACRYATCTITATKTFALVPLCESHYQTIQAETNRFYSGTRPKSEIEVRPHYMQIANLIPWSKENLGQLPGGAK